VTDQPPLTGIIVPVTPFQQNCSIIWCTETMRGAVVDPGGEIDRLLEVAEGQGVTLEKILVTHGHLDHAGATADPSGAPHFAGRGAASARTPSGSTSSRARVRA